MSYEPTFLDLEWTRGLLFLIEEGGIWGLPTSHLTYRVFKKTRMIYLLNPEQLEDPMSQKMHEAATATFEALHYTVHVGEPKPKGRGAGGPG